MATPSAAFVCAILACILWVPVGWLMARRLPLGPDLRLALAPLLGWAGQGIVAWQASMLAGFSATTLLAVTMLLGLAALLMPASAAESPSSARPFPLWAFAAIALVAVGPALGILPKPTADGIALAAPIYDHAKIALVDEMVRSGVPPANPFLGGGSEPGGIAYYYFWLFGAAQLALMSGASGWEADIGATWFTAFASLSLVCGLAFHLSGSRSASILFVLVAALGGSLRPVASALLGPNVMASALEPSTGLAGWFFQSSWSPHHMAAGATVVLSLIMMEQLARRFAAAPMLALALVAAAGFGSSLWVGGVTFAACAGAAGLVLLAGTARRLGLVLTLGAAALVALALVLPLLLQQLHVAAGRGGAVPLAIAPYPVLGAAIPDGIRRLLDVPAYWLVLLPLEFGAAAILGAIAAFRLRGPLVPPLLAAAVASLGVGAVLVSTVGENNDLGWRAVLPGLLILTAFAAAYFARSLARRRMAVIVSGVLLLALALPDGLGLLRSNAVGQASADAARFRDAPALWAAMRRHTAPDERIASNPRMTESLVPWPISLSWALLADRRSCFAGPELALAFTQLSPEAREAASNLFDRVFAGAGTDADLAALVQDFNCRVFMIMPGDGAWNRDPFAARPEFTRVEAVPGQWRIYRAAP